MAWINHLFFANLLFLLVVTLNHPYLAAAATGPSYVYGDISSFAPFSLPPSVFYEATARPVNTSSVPIPGYNISTVAGDPGSGAALSGWTLTASVTPDVPLADSGDETINKTQVTVATRLNIESPGGGIPMRMDSSWRMCATVYVGGLEARGGDPVHRGQTSCLELLPSDCVNEMAVWTAIHGMDADGNCISPGLQTKCQGLIAAHGLSVAFPINQNVINAGSFFAYGSPPGDKGNETAMSWATGTVWPVIVAWKHFAENGETHFSSAYVSCVRASDGDFEDVVPKPAPPAPPAPGHPKDGDRKNVGVSSRGLSRWALVMALGMTLWVVA